jgi:arginyl-tRNA synthetase
MNSSFNLYIPNVACTLERYLTILIKKVFFELRISASQIYVNISDRSQFSQFQCNIAMSLSKKYKLPSMKIACDIISSCENFFILKKIGVISPGFINITLSRNFLAFWNTNLLFSQRLFIPLVTYPVKTMIDFGGPNIAKPLHVGHTRSLLIGDCLKRVYFFCGNSIISDIHLGDWGTQLGILIEALNKIYPRLFFFDSHYAKYFTNTFTIDIERLSLIYSRAYFFYKNNSIFIYSSRLATLKLQIGLKKYRLLWKKLINITILDLKYHYRMLNIRFDLWNAESDIRGILHIMLKKFTVLGIISESQKAIITSSFRSHEKRLSPLILVKSDGVVTYASTDLATALDRILVHRVKKIIYVVDKRQKFHFYQVFNVIKKLFVASSVQLVNIGFGTINNVDGKPLKTRSGHALTMRSLFKQSKKYAFFEKKYSVSKCEHNSVVTILSIAALKFADLSHSFISDYALNLSKFSIQDGRTGPYILYVIVRIKSVLRKVALLNFFPKIRKIFSLEERNLQLLLSRVSNSVFDTYNNYRIQSLCDYAYKVAVAFNKYYSKVIILHEVNITIKYSHVTLCHLTLKVLTFVLRLLGIVIPDKI